MQTLFYVLGPFLLYTGLGVAAVLVAAASIRNVWVPHGRLLRQKHARIAAAHTYAEEAHALVCDLIVETAANHLLADALPGRITQQAAALNRPIIPKENE